MAETPKRPRPAAPRRRRGEAPGPDDPGAPAQSRMYVSLDLEFHRKFAGYCKIHGTTPSAVVRSLLDPLMRGFVIQNRGGAEVPQARVAATGEDDPGLPGSGRRAG